MKLLSQKITAGALALGLVLGCGGCGATLREPDQPVSMPTPLEQPTVPDGTGPAAPGELELTNLSVVPQYPEMPQYPNQADYPDYDEYRAAQNHYYEIMHQYQAPSSQDLTDAVTFLESAIEQFLSGDGNQVCSPLNIFFALAMVAETADGNSRQQILDVLGYRSTEALRQQARQLWEAYYCDDGQTISLLANSVWLDEAYTFNQDILAALGKHHYAYAFIGDLGSAEMNRQLAQWLDAQTGDLLSDYTQNIQLDPSTIFALASTAYFCAGWEDEFNREATYPEVFHAEDRDIDVNFMHQTQKRYYYWDKDFTAISKDLTGDHRMWLILPDKGTSVQELLEQGDYFDLIQNPSDWSQSKYLKVHLSMPKFDVSSQQNLISGLKAMGITDVFDRTKANFDSLTDRTLYISDTQHAARVVVDEEGVLAAAYTLIMYDATSAPPKEIEEIDFVLDRPFLFVITGQGELPLFAGVVNEP